MEKSQLIRLPFNTSADPEVVELLRPEDFDGYYYNQINDCEVVKKSNGDKVWVHKMFLINPNEL